MNWLAYLALLLAAAFGGYAFRGERNQAAISAAESRAATCESTATGNEAALADVQRRLVDLRARHDAALAAATDTLSARDAEIAQLNHDAAQRAAHLRKTADENPDCATLARLPVCAAVAGELWPVHATDTAAAGAR